MSVESNKAVFDIFQQEFTEEVIGAAAQMAETFRKDVRDFTKKYTKQAYIEMMGTFLIKAQDFLRTRRPGENAKTTRGYSVGYYDYKVRKGRDKNGFYNNTGSLKRSLVARDPKKDFGAAKVQFKKQGSGLAKNVKLDTAGRPQFRAGSGRSGFASDAEAFSSLVFSVQVDMFPSIQGKTMESYFMKLPKTENLRVKFATTNLGRSSGYHPARPLLRPFLRWYTTTNLEESMKQKFG